VEAALLKNSSGRLFDGAALCAAVALAAGAAFGQGR
jgi:hypothetical protein